MSTRIIVVGAGISGLTAAHFLRRQGADVRVLEARSVPGGSIRSERRDGFLLEHGPNTTTFGNVHLRDLLRTLDLDARLLIPGSLVRKRFVVRGGRLRLLPSGPGSLLLGGYLSAATLARLLTEPFRRGRAPAEESVADFVGRRFGREIVEYAVKPFISGIYAGDATTLVMEHAFPTLAGLEREYGSVIGGAVRDAFARRKEPRVRGLHASFSLRDGLQELVDALVRDLAQPPDCDVDAVGIEKRHGHVDLVWTRGEELHREEDVHVVVSTPAYAAAPLLNAFDPRAASALASIDYPAVAVVHLGYRRAQVRHALDGFGFLCAPAEGRDVLGCIFSSSLFPGRAPGDHVLLTVYAGGVLRPDVLAGDDDAVIATAHRELASLLGIDGEPVFRNLTRHRRAIPQYGPGYGAAVAELTRFESTEPHIRLCANYRGGISVADCVRAAATLAATWPA